VLDYDESTIVTVGQHAEAKAHTVAVLRDALARPYADAGEGAE